MLQQLPSYIELRSPSPELAQPAIPTSLQPQRSNTASDGQTVETNSQHAEYDIETTGNSFLGDLKFADSFKEFHAPDSHWRTMKEFKFHMDSFGDVTVEQEDTLGTFADRLYKAGHPHRRVSHLEMILMLVNEPSFSERHFLEIVMSKNNGNEVEILEWMSPKINMAKFGKRALGKAASLNNFEAVNMLLDEGVYINDLIVDSHFVPDCCCCIYVIDYAQLLGASDEMIAHLLARGSENPMGLNECLMDQLDCLLHQRCGEGGIFLPKVQALVERIHGFADVIYETGPILETCIRRWEQEDTCAEGRHQVLDYLLDQGFKTSPGSPLAISIFTGCPGELHWNLLERTENINAYCSDREYWYNLSEESDKYSSVRTVTPLQAAALGGKETIIHVLLQKGADINCPARGVGGVTALQAICYLKQRRTRDRAKKKRLVKLLVDGGANVNAGPAFHYGLTALQAAAFVDDVQVADILVSRGADVNAPACKGEGGTALVLAVREAHVDMVRFLLGAGAAVPAAGVTILSCGIPYDDKRNMSDLLDIDAPELETMYGSNGTPSRDYHEYEAEWEEDPTYNRG